MSISHPEKIQLSVYKTGGSVLHYGDITVQIQNCYLAFQDSIMRVLVIIIVNNLSKKWFHIFVIQPVSYKSQVSQTKKVIINLLYYYKYYCCYHRVKIFTSQENMCPFILPKSKKPWTFQLL